MSWQQPIGADTSCTACHQLGTHPLSLLLAVAMLRRVPLGARDLILSHSEDIRKQLHRTASCTGSNPGAAHKILTLPECQDKQLRRHGLYAVITANHGFTM